MGLKIDFDGVSSDEYTKKLAVASYLHRHSGVFLDYRIIKIEMAIGDNCLTRVEIIPNGLNADNDTDYFSRQQIRSFLKCTDSTVAFDDSVMILEWTTHSPHKCSAKRNFSLGVEEDEPDFAGSVDNFDNGTTRLAKDMASKTQEERVSNATTIDCRSELGITVGLIDSLISICRVLAIRDLSLHETQEALKDFCFDSDLTVILNSVAEPQKKVNTMKLNDIGISLGEALSHLWTNKTQDKHIDGMIKSEIHHAASCKRTYVAVLTSRGGAGIMNEDAEYILDRFSKSSVTKINYWGSKGIELTWEEVDFSEWTDQILGEMEERLESEIDIADKLPPKIDINIEVENNKLSVAEVWAHLMQHKTANNSIDGTITSVMPPQCEVRQTYTAVLYVGQGDYFISDQAVSILNRFQNGLVDTIKTWGNEGVELTWDEVPT